MATISFERNIVIKDNKKIEEIQRQLEKTAVALPYREKELTEEEKGKIKKWFCR